MRHAVRLNDPMVWGAKVHIVPIRGSARDDFLVAFDGTNIYTHSDITINADGDVATGHGTALSEVSSITIIPDPKPTAPNQMIYGFNKYIIDGATPTISN